jgi:hypothetical protein
MAWLNFGAAYGFGLGCIVTPVGLKAIAVCCVAKCVSSWNIILHIMYSRWSVVTSCRVVVFFRFSFLVVVRVFTVVAVLYLTGAVVCRGCWWSLLCLVLRS